MPTNPQMKANLKPSEKRLLQASHLAAQAKLQEMQRQMEEDSAVLQARARRCSRCPVPYAFSPETPGARKCNREARCGGYPNPARYRLPRNRAHLLAVTINAAICCVNVRAALKHSRLRLRINIGLFFVPLRIEVSDLPIRNHGQSHPRESERAKDPEKEEQVLS